MRGMERAVVLLRLVDQLREQGSWTGETHVQKAAYLLSKALNVPLEQPFTLYKHGPFSFELREELNHLSSTGQLQHEPQPPPYGPKLGISEIGRRLLKRHEQAWLEHDDAIRQVSAWLGGRGVKELERLATAWYLLEQYPDSDGEALAREICALKPHIDEEQARWAVEEARQFGEAVQRGCCNS